MTGVNQLFLGTFFKDVKMIAFGLLKEPIYFFT